MRPLCVVYNVLLDANGTHHYHYIRCNMSKVLSNKHDYEPNVFLLKIYFLHTL